MRSILKYTLWSLFGLVASVSTVLAYLALSFDPNEYKPQIIQAVQESTHRTLKLDGDIKLMLFPSIGAHLGEISLSESGSEKVFASVADASVSLAVWPLLQKQIVVNQVSLSGVRMHLVKYKDGKTNLDDLFQNGANGNEVSTSVPQSSPLDFDVAGVSIEDCELRVDDQEAGNEITLTVHRLNTGRLANSLSTPLEFSAQIRSLQPQADISLEMKTSLSFALRENRFSLKGTELDASGQVQEVTGLKLKLAGDANLNLRDKEYEVNLFVLNVSGMKSGETFVAHLDVPAISLKGEELSGKNLRFNAGYTAESSKADVTLNLTEFNGDPEKFTLKEISLQALLEQKGVSFNAKLDAGLIGSLKTRQFNLKDLDIVLKGSGAELPGEVLEAALKGSVQVDMDRQNVHAKFTGEVQQSHVRLEAALKNFTVPVVRYDLEIDKLDISPFLTEKTGGKQQETSAEQTIDLAALKMLDANGSLRIGALKVADVEMEKVRVDMKAVGGVVTVAPISLGLYHGNLDGKIVVDANSNSFLVTQRLRGVEIAPLMKDAADLTLAEGTGNVALKLDARGNTISALKRSLNGTASIDLADGAVRGIDLGKLVQGVQNLNKDSKAETLGFNKDEKTEFSEFKATLKVRDGVAHNEDLSVRSTVLRLNGSGDVDIGQDRMDYQAKVIMAKTEQGKTGTLPVRIHGPFVDLKIRVDYAALVKDLARQRLNEQKAAIKVKLDARKAAAKAKLEAEKAAARAKAQDKLKEGLKGLFK